jgi:hypothetical protein
MKIQQILKDLEELEKKFFIPVNAHPLKKISASGGAMAGMDNSKNDSSFHSKDEENHIP